MMLIDRIRKTIEEHDLAGRGQHIVLGLSGGPDSVCLFHVLMRLQERLGITVHPVHLNHKFRPGEAERDQRYVEELCRRMGVECRVFTIDCAALAKELSVTGEEAGRMARYDVFYETAEDIVQTLVSGGSDPKEARKKVSIAVAHNANDQVETILFRLLRGTGTDGLAGMAYRRSERGFDVIRPLLDADRQSIEEYCEKNGLAPVTDHTNNEMLYARNRIRLELLPFLRKGYNENIDETLLRLGRIATEDKDYLWEQVEKAYGETLLQEGTAQAADTADAAHDASGAGADGEGEKIASGATENGAANIVVMDRAKLSALHGAIRHRLVMKAFAQIGLDKDISEERLKAADAVIEKKQAPKVVEFPHGYRLEVARGRVVFSDGRSGK